MTTTKVVGTRMDADPNHLPATEHAWGAEVVEEDVRGKPCRVYERRRHRVAELLVDARTWSDRVHAVQGGIRLSYLEHERAVARVAEWLDSRGIGPGDRVMLFARNSLELSVAFWATHVRGAVAVLANAWWSKEEIQTALSGSEISLLLHDDYTSERLPPEVVAVDVDELTSLLNEKTAPPLTLPQISEDAPALVIFTSGSTGDPKGVVLSQRSYLANLQNLLLVSRRLPGPDSASRPRGVNLMTAPLFHLSGVQVVSAALVAGNELVYQSGRFDAGEVLRLIEEERVSTWGAVPAMVTRVMEHPDFSRRNTSTLRSISMGGSSATPAFRGRVTAAFPNLKGGGAGSLYGLTEAGGLVATASGEETRAHPGTVGRLLPIVHVRIGNPDAEGNGEILVRSPALMSGYLGTDTESPVDDDGWLHTGDAGHVEDNFLFLSGRLKDIVIRGGENISCLHVEQALNTHPAVAEAVVVSLPHEQLDEQVGAVIMLSKGANATVEELTKHAAEHLGKFQIPTRWWLRRDLVPTNPQGKVVRRDVRKAWLKRSEGADILEGHG